MFSQKTWSRLPEVPNQSPSQETPFRLYRVIKSSQLLLQRHAPQTNKLYLWQGFSPILKQVVAQFLHRLRPGLQNKPSPIFCPLDLIHCNPLHTNLLIFPSVSRKSDDVLLPCPFSAVAWSPHAGARQFELENVGKGAAAAQNRQLLIISTLTQDNNHLWPRPKFAKNVFPSLLLSLTNRRWRSVGVIIDTAALSYFITEHVRCNSLISAAVI